MADNAKDIIASAVKKMNEAVNYLEEDLKTYRAGKANPGTITAILHPCPRWPASLCPMPARC